MDRVNRSNKVKGKSAVLLAAVLAVACVFCALCSGCQCRYIKEKEYRVDRIKLFGVEYDNTGEVIWHDGLMVIDLVWVLEKLGIELEWDNERAAFTLDGVEYVLDVNARVFCQKDQASLNYLDPGAGYSFTGTVNERFYADSVTLIHALRGLHTYVLVDSDRSHHLVEIYHNPNYNGTNE